MLPIYARVFARLPADIPRTFHKVKVIFPGLRFDAMKIFWKGTKYSLYLRRGGFTDSSEKSYNISKIVSRVNKNRRKLFYSRVSLIFKVSEQR